MRLYTKTGDAGQTGLFGGDRVSKADAVIHAVGDLDELNCRLGLAAACDLDPATLALITRVQAMIFEVGSQVTSRGSISCEPEPLTRDLESELDRQASILPAMRSFILPGGSREAAELHLCRAVCRRCERTLVAAADSVGLTPETLAFINRLSDWLFSAARLENHRRNRADVPWKKS
ncbi:MAG: cob(I)yrinic acid a,c-diamide adenosyltransferase [Fimbriimonadaceae bacterium]|nr:cob(I)yrinic acid a,c-diamide adenosyltransferase [Fimbriimonadaceae bacterium]